jgi:cyclin L
VVVAAVVAAAALVVAAVVAAAALAAPKISTMEAQLDLLVPDYEAWHRVVLLPKEILEAPPSKVHGIEWETEAQHRAWGCELIQEAGVLLRLPQVVMCTGQTLLQRFYYRKSLTKFDAFSVAMGCVLLAAKIEETMGTTRLRDVVMVFHRMYLRRRGLPIEFLELGGSVYAELKSEVSKLQLTLCYTNSFLCADSATEEL